MFAVFDNHAISFCLSKCPLTFRSVTFRFVSFRFVSFLHVVYNSESRERKGTLAQEQENAVL